VFWVVTASAKIVQSTAAPPPFSTPVCSTTFVTASLIRCGRSDFAIRFRQYTSHDGSNTGSSRPAPIAALHRASNRTASAVSRSE
jgi:hypothetical protein